MSSGSAGPGRRPRRLAAAARGATAVLAMLLAVATTAPAQSEPLGPSAPAASPSPTQVAPDWVVLRAELEAAQRQFEDAQRTRAQATERIAQLNRDLVAQQTAAAAAKRQIERFARWAYISARDAEVAGILGRIAAGDMSSLAEAQMLLASAGNVQTRQLRDAVGVLAQIQRLKAEVETVEREASAAMAGAQEKGRALEARLQALAAALGPEPPMPTVTPNTCPKAAPPGSLTDGAEAIGVYKLCRQSVRQARSPAAARAIKWAFNHLGVRYIDGWVAVDIENYDGFHCANLVARAYYWGARFGAFMSLPWTPAYAAPPPFVQPVKARPKAGDINIMWRSPGGIAASGGQAGHAQMFIADGWVIQSGGIAGPVNVARYPNGWPGWQEVQFQVNAPA